MHLLVRLARITASLIKSSSYARRVPTGILIVEVILASCICSPANLALGQNTNQNWPAWRGPRGDGHAKGNVPTEWNVETGENLKWQVEVPGQGHASPIVWNDRVYLVSCLTDRHERILLAYDLSSGEETWRQTVLKAPLESKHALNSHASGTPATDGESIYVTFQEVDGKRTVPAPNVGTSRQITPGVMVVAAYDMDGKLRWLQRVGDFLSAHGYCSCPVLFENLVIVNGDHDGDSYVVALDKASGEEVWRKSRRHKTRSYVTPIIREIKGRPELVFSGSQCIVSLDPRTGTEHWRIEGPTEQFVASMVYGRELFFMTCGYPDYHVMGIRPGGEGEVTETHVAWHETNARSYVPSPLFVNDCLFVADDRGTVNCYRARDGKRHWKQRLGNGFSASPICVDDLVYFVANDGKTTIVRPSPQFEVVAENELGDHVSASPAVSDRALVVRTETRLICIRSN